MGLRPQHSGAGGGSVPSGAQRSRDRGEGPTPTGPRPSWGSAPNAAELGRGFRSQWGSAPHAVGLGRGLPLQQGAQEPGVQQAGAGTIPAPSQQSPASPVLGRALAPVCLFALATSRGQGQAGTGNQPGSVPGAAGNTGGGGQGAAPCGVHVLGVQNATGRVSADPTTPSASVDQSDPVPAPSTDQSDPVPAHGSAVAGGCARQVSGSARELRALCPSLLCLVLPVSAVAWGSRCGLRVPPGHGHPSAAWGSHCPTGHPGVSRSTSVAPRPAQPPPPLVLGTCLPPPPAP